MKRFVFTLIAAVIAVCLAGCDKAEDSATITLTKQEN